MSIQKLRKASQRQEKRTAKEVGGKVQIASGAIVSVGMKGDVRSGKKSTGFNEEDYLIENKLTTTTSYTLNIDTWLKIQKEATRDSLRIPVLQIDIQNLSLIVTDYDTIFDRFRTKSVFLSELEVKKSITINKHPYNELSEICRRYGDILISKFTYQVPVRIKGRTKIKKIHLGVVEKIHWKW